MPVVMNNTLNKHIYSLFTRLFIRAINDQAIKNLYILHIYIISSRASIFILIHEIKLFPAHSFTSYNKLIIVLYK